VAYAITLQSGAESLMTGTMTPLGANMAVSSNTSDWFPNTAATHHMTPDLASL